MRSTRFAVWALVLLGFLVAILAFQKDDQLPGYIFAGIALVLGAWQVYVASPSPGAIRVERQAELNLDDLIFFLAPYPGSTREEIPRDFLLQLHVAVTNAGGRKVALSRLDLTSLRNDRGQVVRIPDVPAMLSASLYRVRQVYTPQGPSHIGAQFYLPLTLEPDDVLTMRFRFRRGVDWSESWDLGKLAELCSALSRPITAATLTLVYRSGAKVMEREIRVPIKTVQQEKYASMLRSMTRQFTRRPDVPPQYVPIE